MSKAVRDRAERLLRWKRFPDKKGEFWNVKYQDPKLKDMFWEKYNKEKDKGLSNKECFSRAREYTENRAMSLGIEIRGLGNRKSVKEPETTIKWRGNYVKVRARRWKVDDQNQILKDIFWLKYHVEKNKGLEVKDCMRKASSFTESKAIEYGMKIKYEDLSK